MMTGSTVAVAGTKGSGTKAESSTVRRRRARMLLSVSGIGSAKREMVRRQCVCW